MQLNAPVIAQFLQPYHQIQTFCHLFLLQDVGAPVIGDTVIPGIEQPVFSPQQHNVTHDLGGEEISAVRSVDQPGEPSLQVVPIYSLQSAGEFMMPGDQCAAEGGVVVIVCFQLLRVVLYMKFLRKLYICFFPQVIIQLLVGLGTENPDSVPEQGGKSSIPINRLILIICSVFFTQTPVCPL